MNVAMQRRGRFVLNLRHTDLSRAETIEIKVGAFDVTARVVMVFFVVERSNFVWFVLKGGVHIG